jgi:thiol:disulfide interchange protein DsbD
VAPPLIAALTVISQTATSCVAVRLVRDEHRMGTPLLLVGASAGKLLPRAGAWMDTVKNLFGVLFLASRQWMLARHRAGMAQHDHLGQVACVGYLRG